MDKNSLFEYATRNKLRFTSVRGDLNVEQLWDVPLRSNDDLNLGKIALTVNKNLKDATEESFVDTVRTAEHTRLEVRLEIVKHIIECKRADEAAVKKRAENRVEKEQLLAILAEKQLGKLIKLSEKDIQTRIQALEA